MEVEGLRNFPHRIERILRVCARTMQSEGNQKKVFFKKEREFAGKKKTEIDVFWGGECQPIVYTGGKKKNHGPLMVKKKGRRT